MLLLLKVLLLQGRPLHKTSLDPQPAIGKVFATIVSDFFVPHPTGAFALESCNDGCSLSRCVDTNAAVFVVDLFVFIQGMRKSQNTLFSAEIALTKVFQQTRSCSTQQLIVVQVFFFFLLLVIIIVFVVLLFMQFITAIRCTVSIATYDLWRTLVRYEKPTVMMIHVVVVSSCRRLLLGLHGRARFCQFFLKDRGRQHQTKTPVVTATTARITISRCPLFHSLWVGYASSSSGTNSTGDRIAVLVIPGRRRWHGFRIVVRGGHGTGHQRFRKGYFGCLEKTLLNLWNIIAIIFVLDRWSQGKHRIHCCSCCVVVAAACCGCCCSILLLRRQKGQCFQSSRIGSRTFRNVMTGRRFSSVLRRHGCRWCCA
mmetsp:Transcript_25535/g.45007  ORF Transcript_25535/g.45007 Transcript_25535/m.45007 type:complete len:369 (-) Transcript_25535:898-2004(-)